MPGLGHIVFGLALIIPVMYYSKNKFNYKVAFIFLANNYIGPDASHVFSVFGVDFHNVIGFLVFAIPLSLFYTYMSRFSIVRTDNFLRIRLQDDGIREVKWLNAYMITVAGGMTHFFIDTYFHWERTMAVLPWYSITHDQMLHWGGAAYHVVDPLMVVGYLIIMGSIIMSLFVFKRGYKDTFIFTMIVAGLSLLTIALLGIESFGGEREIAVMFNAAVFFLIPLFLLMYAARDVEDNPITEKEVSKIDRNLLLKIVSGIIMVASGLLILLGMIATLFTNIIMGLLPAYFLTGSVNYVLLFQVAGIALIVVGIVLLIGAIGLLLKINVCRRIVMIIGGMLLIIVFPFAITLLLCENEIRDMFVKK